MANKKVKDHDQLSFDLNEENPDTFIQEDGQLSFTDLNQIKRK